MNEGNNGRGAQENIAASFSCLTLSASMRNFSAKSGYGLRFIAEWDEAEKGLSVGVEALRPASEEGNPHWSPSEEQIRDWARTLIRAERLMFLQKMVEELKEASKQELTTDELVEHFMDQALEVAVQLNPDKEHELREAALKSLRGA